MSGDTFMLIMTSFLGFLAIFYVIGFFRGRQIQKTNEQIEQNQHNLIALQERQVSALERIATQLEKRQ